MEAISPQDQSHQDLYDRGTTDFEKCVLEDQWEDVIKMYEQDPYFHTIELKGRGTALHVAINNGHEICVKLLVNAILKHIDQSGLRLPNEKGATPLHLAAQGGFTSMCEYIIGEKGQRRDLIHVENSNGETPIFWTVLARQRETFVYLNKFILQNDDTDEFVPYESYDMDFAINNDGTSILHVAIDREIFDLANIILYYYPYLGSMMDKNEVRPLEVLATRTSAFKSGNTLLWWEKILYKCIPVKLLDAKTLMKSYQKSVKKEKNNDLHEISIPLKDALEEAGVLKKKILEEAAKVRDALERLDFISCAKILCHRIQKFASGLPNNLSPFDLEAIKIIKNKHQYGYKLLEAFMGNPSESYTGSGDRGVDEDEENFAKYIRQEPRDLENTTKEETEENEKREDSAKKDTTFFAVAKSDMNEIMKELDSKVPVKKGLLLVAMKNIKSETEKKDKNETAFLIAAKNGIIEMICEIYNQMNSVVRETNSNTENVLLLAVKNRQCRVVELLKRLPNDIFPGLIAEVDNNGNTMLHLAACASIQNENTWRVSGAAMQMMWDIKWYKYIKGLVPDHFSLRSNKEGKTPGEIFKEQHKEILQNSSDWLKDTAESCSVVAALIAGVSFATSGSVPGGNQEETGKPTLEEQPAFEGFAISAFIGLYFSVTALIMFLSILTSRKQVEDFSGNLPKKLLFGLSSLFVSIVAMLVSFCAGHFFVLTDKYCKRNILFYLYISLLLPVTFYAVVQFPLYFDLIKVIWKKVPPPSVKGVHL